ncbi:hypothetical protein PLEOSDRAFT_161587 [Pleurotus ostreatus PC15]|uniref:Uncharacterized protein n=1 Tax=Pleurotus ostreatus (strain PC15) TaxID=1137138 RepID=A0A067NBS2_PLEO1|nr:hypothetical protein PLEOSDRAFT_161587 [Pleurotus ostreatus PC15]
MPATRRSMCGQLVFVFLLYEHLSTTIDILHALAVDRYFVRVGILRPKADGSSTRLFHWEYYLAFMGSTHACSSVVAGAPGIVTFRHHSHPAYALMTPRNRLPGPRKVARMADPSRQTGLAPSFWGSILPLDQTDVDEEALELMALPECGA